MQSFNTKYRSKEKLKDFINKHNLSNTTDILIQVFCGKVAIEAIRDLQKILNTLLPQAVMIGTTTDGEIIDGRILTKQIVLSFSVFEKTKLTACMIENENDECFKSGVLLADNLIKHDTKALILFADSMHTNGEELLNGVYSVNSSVIVTGGLAGDGEQFEQSYVFTNDQISSNGVVGVALHSESLLVSNKHHYDWEPVGREFAVTKSEKNRVFEINGMSAYALYEKYLGKEAAKKLPLSGIQFPLVVKRDGHFIARTCIANPGDGSLVFAGNIEENEVVQIAFGNMEKILKTSQRSFKELENRPIESIFLYSCIARKQFLGKNINYEIEPYNQIAVNAGFFTYGEFFTTPSRYEFLNETMTVLLLSEDTEVKHKVKKNRFQYTLDEANEAIKALSNIALVASRELQELNYTLEERVQKQVEINRKKDQILIHNNKLAQMGEMISMIAHQWRQPLNAISATASGLEIKVDLDQYQKTFFGENLIKIQEYVAHLSKTMDDFTNFFKPNKQKETMYVKEIIEKSLYIFSASLLQNNIKIIKNYSSVDKITTYASEVMQVILNIIKNAEDIFKLKKIAEPVIVISEYQKKDKYIIEICDNGGGIPKEIIGKIFDPYFSTKEKNGGTGLGLYMSKIIIEDSCEGTLTVENCHEGAKFTITL